MKIFPDFTWEYIVGNCEGLKNWTINERMNLLPERRNQYIALADALLAAIAKMREHPQLTELVPMMSVMSLRWFPTADREFDLYFNSTSYAINVFSKSGIEAETINEEKVVAIDDVADEIYAYITKLRDD